jgi:hypothetical protein
MRPYQVLFAPSSNEALAKLPPRVEQLARFRLRELAEAQIDGSAPGDERPLNLFELPPYAFAYVVDHDLHAVILERVYVVLRADEAREAAGPHLIAPDGASPLRH